ncbi:hypothetical protein EMCRGX_G016501 [Ephydatia muelleri]
MQESYTRVYVCVSTYAHLFDGDQLAMLDVFLLRGIDLFKAVFSNKCSPPILAMCCVREVPNLGGTYTCPATHSHYITV